MLLSCQAGLCLTCSHVKKNPGVVCWVCNPALGLIIRPLHTKQQLHQKSCLWFVPTATHHHHPAKERVWLCGCCPPPSLLITQLVSTVAVARWGPKPPVFWAHNKHLHSHHHHKKVFPHRPDSHTVQSRLKAPGLAVDARRPRVPNSPTLIVVR